MEDLRRFVVVIDAIAGQGVVFTRGRIVSSEELWGQADFFVRQGAIVPAEEAPYIEPTHRNSDFRRAYLG
jgi:hypothetical protein